MTCKDIEKISNWFYELVKDNPNLKLQSKDLKDLTENYIYEATYGINFITNEDEE